MTRPLRIMAAVAALLLAVPALQAQDTSAQESRRAALQKEIAQLEQQIRDNSTRSSNALNELTLVRRQVAARRSLVQESEREVARLRDTIAARQAEADRLQRRLETMETYYRRLVRSAYKNRDTHLWYSYLLSSKDLGQAARRYTYLRDLSGQMNSQARKLKEMRAKLGEDLVRLSALRKEAEDIRAAREKELLDLRAEEQRSDKLVASLQQDKAKYQRQLEAKRKQVEALNREIERIIAQAIEDARKKQEAAAAGNRNTKPVDVQLAGEFAANKGKLPWPADGPVVEGFGQHNHPVYTTLVMPANNGINIGLPADAEILSVYDGEV